MVPSSPYTATPDTGYSFHKWESNVSISDPLSPNLELQVTEDLNITATFNKISYDLSVELAGNGAVQGGGNYFHGETVNLIASPAKDPLLNPGAAIQFQILMIRIYLSSLPRI